MKIQPDNADIIYELYNNFIVYMYISILFVLTSCSSKGFQQVEESKFFENIGL